MSDIVKAQLEVTCDEIRKREGLSSNPGPGGCALKWRSEGDWSICYKGIRYVPLDFSDADYPNKVARGEGASIDKQLQQKQAAQAAVNLATDVEETKKEEKEVVDLGEVKSNGETTNMLLIFDEAGQDITNSCELKMMKNDSSQRVDWLLLDGKKIGEIKTGKVTMIDEKYQVIICKNVTNTPEALQAKQKSIGEEIREKLVALKEKMQTKLGEAEGQQEIKRKVGRPSKIV